MTLRKSEASRRELELLRAGAATAGKQFAVRYSLDDKTSLPLPLHFYESLAEAQGSATATFTRLNTGDGGDVHARPADMKRVEVWLERLVSGEWQRDPDSVQRGFYDTNPRSKR
jgi:hypothetical protein